MCYEWCCQWLTFYEKFGILKKHLGCDCVGGGEEVCEEEVGVCEGTVDYVVDIILYILEEVCEEEVCVCVCVKGLYIMYRILFCTY